MFWWFEREGAYARCEVLEITTGNYELRVVWDDGHEEVEHFRDAHSLAERQKHLIDDLGKHGWTGPHGWVL